MVNRITEKRPTNEKPTVMSFAVSGYERKLIKSAAKKANCSMSTVVAEGAICKAKSILGK